MKTLWALLRREIRAHQLAFGAYFALTLLLDAFAVLTAPENPERFGLTMLPLVGLLFFAPLLLVHAFASERRNHQVYLLFALPVARWQVALVRVIANLVHTLGILVVGLGGALWAYQRGLASEVQVSGSLALLLALGILAYLVLLYGLVLGMETLRSVPLRGRSLWGAASALLGFYLALRGAAHGLYRVLPALSLDFTFVDATGRVFQKTANLQPLEFAVVFGLLWGALALWGFHRFAEV